MKLTIRLLPLVALIFSWLNAAEPVKTNIILIILEDQGFPDYGFMGHKTIAPPP